MAIPPIISNSPIFKLLRGQGNESTQQVQTAPQTQEDVVTLSEAAQQRLDAIRDLRASGNDAVAQTAQDTAEILQNNPDINLGADPAFDNGD